MKKILFAAVMAIIAWGVNAQGPAKVPAYRGIIEHVQPDGDTLRTYLRGDEHMHWMMTHDGWQIFQNDKGWYVYAEQKGKKQPQIVESRKKAHNASDRSKCEKKWLQKHGVQKQI